MKPEEFRERLGSLESLLDDALRDAGEEEKTDDGRLVRVAEGALDLYARLARILEEGSVAEALSELGWRPKGDESDFGRDAEFERALMPLLRFLFQSWWRVDVVGVERVPEEGPVLLVANSAGALFAYDGAMLRMAVRERHAQAREVRPLLEPRVCALPILGDLLSRCGGVPASRENAETLLARGEVVGAFPEGGTAFEKVYRRRYELSAFEDLGAIGAALDAGAPIVPVAIVGAEDAQPVLGRLDWIARRIGVPAVPLTPTFPWLGVGGLLPLPSRWRIEFGAPFVERLGTAGGDPEDPRRLRRAGEGVRRRLQALVRRAVERRGRAYF